jgi:hypothetical protein
MASPAKYTILVVLCAALYGGCASVEPRMASEVGPQSSWEEIRGTPGLIVNAPMISFGARAVSVTDVCRGGDRLRATTADGSKLETAVAGNRSSYMIEVGRIVGDAETSKFRALFVKPFEVPACT